MSGLIESLGPEIPHTVAIIIVVVIFLRYLSSLSELFREEKDLSEKRYAELLHNNENTQKELFKSIERVSERNHETQDKASEVIKELTRTVSDNTAALGELKVVVEHLGPSK
jgi:uncharacterized membrane protein YhiD involved in acid resistance